MLLALAPYPLPVCSLLYYPSIVFLAIVTILYIYHFYSTPGNFLPLFFALAFCSHSLTIDIYSHKTYYNSLCICCLVIGLNTGLLIVGVVQYTTMQYKRFYLLTYLLKQAIISALKIRYKCVNPRPSYSRCASVRLLHRWYCPPIQ